MKDSLEINLANAQIPIEEIEDLVDDYLKQRPMTYDPSLKASKTKRILILNGTVYSERPNQIMGKLIVEVSYKQERVLIES